MRSFDRFARKLRPHLEARYGTDVSRRVLRDARGQYLRLLPELPRIGGVRNIFSPVMTVNGWGVALFRAMKAAGYSAEDTVRVCAELSDQLLRSIPAPLLRIFGRLAFSAPSRFLLARQAARSQKRRYSEDFVYRFETGGDDDGALVFEECAVNKFYRKQQATELAPYCNFFDVTYSRLMHMGLNADETIGLGCQTCQLRYKYGRETSVPERLQGILPKEPLS